MLIFPFCFHQLGELLYRKSVYNQEKHPFFFEFFAFLAEKNKKILFNCDF